MTNSYIFINLYKSNESVSHRSNRNDRITHGRAHNFRSHDSQREAFLSALNGAKREIVERKIRSIGIHQRTKLFNPPIIRMRPGHVVSKTGAARFATISRRIMAFKNKGARHWSKITPVGGK